MRAVCRKSVWSRFEIWIYGAGRIGKRVYRALEKAGFLLEGFLVSDRGNQPEVLYGRPVCTFEEFAEPDEHTMVVVAMSEAYYNQIRELLENRKVKYLYYRTPRP